MFLMLIEGHQVWRVCHLAKAISFHPGFVNIILLLSQNICILNMYIERYVLFGESCKGYVYKILKSMMLPYGDIQSNAHFDFRPMVLAGMYYVLYREQ